MSLLQVHSGVRGLVEENPRRKQKRLRSYFASKVWSNSKIPMTCSSLHSVSALQASCMKNWPTSYTTTTFAGSTTYGLQAVNTISAGALGTIRNRHKPDLATRQQPDRNKGFQKKWEQSEYVLVSSLVNPTCLILPFSFTAISLPLLEGTVIPA